MKSERSFSGWVASLTVTITLTLSLLAVEKHFSKSGSRLWNLAQKSDYLPWFLSHQSVHTGQAPRRIENYDSRRRQTLDHLPHRVSASKIARKRHHDSHTNTSKMLRRPPEPASGAILREPLTPEDFVALPLTQGSSRLGLLMESMDAAFQSPVKMVSLSSETDNEQDTAAGESKNASPSTSAFNISPLFAVPVQLFTELEEVQQAIRRVVSTEDAGMLTHTNSPQAQRPVGVRNLSVAQATEIENWITRTRRLLQVLTSERSLPKAEVEQILDELQELSIHSMRLGDQLQNDHIAHTLIRTGYSVQRRADVWSAVQACLDNSSAQFIQTQSAEVSNRRLVNAIKDVIDLVGRDSEGQAWQNFLLLQELNQWAQSPDEVWRANNSLAKKCLARIQHAQLDEKQQQFLQHEKIVVLTNILANWNRDPVNYHHLLANIEQVEQSIQSRTMTAIAESIQALSQSEHATQQRLAATLNGHYRNANLRVTISQDLLEKFLPQEQFEVRPIHQTILGARTFGDSTVQTRLSVKFHNDPNAWNIELSVVGDVVSNTSSSKGPAVFHNTGVAQVHSQRFLKIGPDGYSISSSPTAVASQDFLNRMSTDFDGLPIIGEFARLIAREQFNQKRGIAKRITQRKIAQETDTELDKKLEENLKQYEQQLEQRILGPLTRLRLDPQVISMSTTAGRLAVRYRLAHNLQLSAFSPRPRAPSGSLISFQVHQSALNNTLDRIGLNGRTWTLPELYNHIGSIFKTTMAPPDDVPDDISIRFADRNPISFEMLNGHLRLHLRIAEFKRQEGLQARNFIVTSTYIPLADGLDAGLIRDPDGVVEIQGKNLAIRDRLALRVIFAKVFVSQPKFSLISQQWQTDPKAKGLAISQLEVRGGWLAVALSAEGNEMAAEVAERTRLIKSKLQSATAASEHPSEYR